jgi:hypothetical protein
VAKLAGLASAADDVRSDTINVKAFTGKAMSCRKAFAGFSNCCKDSGWGADAGLAACNSDEMAIGQAKAKKVTVKVGDRCDHQVLGVCVQKSQVYCVFQGKLARIIQEQGRRDQLGVSFGSGDSPDCRGITVPELQAINFDLINFADFYEDLMNNQKIPDASTMAQLAKDRVAAQVNQMGAANNENSFAFVCCMLSLPALAEEIVTPAQPFTGWFWYNEPKKPPEPRPQVTPKQPPVPPQTIPDLSKMTAVEQAQVLQGLTKEA